MAWIAFYIVGSGGLTEAQQQNNADMFYQVMSGYGFSAAACAAIWSNILCESGGNPMAWETGNAANGRGLVQWTPSTKLSNWAAQNNLNPDDGNVQCRRLYLEFTQGGAGTPYEQYYPTTNFPETAAQFMNASVNAHDIEYWSEAFTRNYERPNETAFQNRKETQFAYARTYYQRFSGEQPPSGSYRINVNVSGNGYVTLEPPRAAYTPREVVRVRAIAYTEYSLESITSVPDVGLTVNNLTFEMPSSNVIITATFSGSGGGGGEPETIDLVLRLTTNANLEVWRDGKYVKFLPNEQNTFKLKIEEERNTP